MHCAQDLDIEPPILYNCSVRRKEKMANQKLIDELVEALRAWEKVESEMGDNHPCPDLMLRATYRKTAIQLTQRVLAKVQEIGILEPRYCIWCSQEHFGYCSSKSRKEK